MFAEKIKSLRQNKGLTQSQLAKELNISSGAIAMWETDKRIPDAHMLVKIADYFGVSVDCLIRDTIDPTIISDVYLKLFREFQNEKVDPADIRIAIDILKRLKKSKA